MIERSQHLRFALEPGKPLRIIRKRFRQDFDGYVTSKLGVVRAVHLAHSARAYGREDFVRAKFGARGDRHKPTFDRELPEYTAARPFAGKIREDYGAKSFHEKAGRCQGT